MSYSFNFNLVFSFWPVFLTGLFWTLLLSVISFSVGFILSLLLILAKKSNNVVIVKIAHIYSIVFKAIPALVMIIWVYYALPILIGINFSPFLAALIALSINVSPFIAESILSGINAIPKDQYESAVIFGFSKYQNFQYIILPQVLRNISPDLLGWFITLLKFTSLVSIIGFDELLHVSNIVISNTYLPFEVYTTLAGIYLVLILVIETFFTKFTKINYKSVI